MEHFACDLKDLKEKTKIRVIINDKPILIVYDKKNVYAINDKCPHMGASLYKGDIIDGCVVCRLHKSKIDLKTGKLLNPPHIMFIKMKGKDARAYKTTIKEDKIYINI